ncbi:hypothetical protein [Nocardioides nematodiphilus]|uniref:hypothetical protein n=1 Tax=Nocardioides nematodiphilus TaxID=2849669 RepID=UPI001CD96F0F|nr:hypothetical protein [Nocardioides nematodiphilus]MCA1982653.1 hypothetical protein [Nocardioides nematodiphilus]
MSTMTIPTLRILTHAGPAVIGKWGWTRPEKSLDLVYLDIKTLIQRWGRPGKGSLTTPLACARGRMASEDFKLVG